MTDLRLSESAKRRLDDLKEALIGALGDTLVALLVYGSAAGGKWREGESDVDVAVVLHEAQRAQLEAMTHPLQIARSSERIEVVILTAAEIPRSADVFPLLYEEIRQHHVLLWGSDPFERIQIAERHRRLRIEQELRDAQIRLRRVVIDTMGSHAAFGHAVARKARSVRSALRALLSSRGVRCGEDLSSVFEAVGLRWGVDTKPILHALEHPVAAHEALVNVLSRAIDDVDSTPEE